MPALGACGSVGPGLSHGTREKPEIWMCALNIQFLRVGEGVTLSEAHAGHVRVLRALSSQQRAGWGLDPTRPGDMAPAGASSKPVPTRPRLAQASVRKDAFGKPARGRQAPGGAAGDMLTSSKSSSSSSLVRTFSDAADATAPALPGQNGFTSRGRLSPSPPPEGRPLSTPLHEESGPGKTSNRDFESKLLPQL